MNWMDLLVLGIIVGVAIYGMYKGLINSLYRLLSYFLSIILAIKLSPVVSKLLADSSIFTKVKEAVQKSVEGKMAEISEAGAQVTKQALVDKLPLPGFLRDNIAEGVRSGLSGSGLVEPISHQVALAVMDILAVVLVFILLKVGLSFLAVVIKGISKLPVLKQVDKLGGIVFGAVAGILVVYVAFAVLMIFNSEKLFTAMNDSTIAQFFFEKNFIISWLFPGSGS